MENGNPNYSSENGVLFNVNKTTLVECPGGKSGEYTIPNSVTEIGYMAFSNCSNLTSVSIPSSVIIISGDAFWKCSSLTSVTIPNSVTYISQRAFVGCESLKSVTLPSSVIGIMDWAFWDCENLKTIYDLNPTPQTLGNLPFKNVPSDAVVYIPKGSFNKYFMADGWAQFSDFREMGDLDILLSEYILRLAVGENAAISATVTKDDDVTINSETWSSSNPDVATVENSTITAVSPGDAIIYFTLIDGYGLVHTEECRVTVSKQSAIDPVLTDTDTPVDVCTLQGVTVLRNAAPEELNTLPAGIYIVRQGADVRKIAVR